jgi:hypothetical protein
VPWIAEGSLMGLFWAKTGGYSGYRGETLWLKRHCCLALLLALAER